MKKASLIFILFFIALPLPALEYKIKDKINKVVLSNGLTFLHVENKQSPTVAGHIRYKVGSVNEHEGITGISHLVEHMLFKGTASFGTTNYKKELELFPKIDAQAKIIDDLEKNLMLLRTEKDNPDFKDQITSLQSRKENEIEGLKVLQADAKNYLISNELSRIYSQHGGENFNAFTSPDCTHYFISLPANKLELWAILEADRLENTIFREFYAERDVVNEERLWRYENSPEGYLYENFITTAFRVHPYKLPTIGYESDVRFINRNQAYSFYKTNYNPNNVIIAIVGNVSFEKALKLIKTYFEPIKNHGKPTELFSIEPEQRGERRINLNLNAEPVLIVGYHKPEYKHKDTAALDILSKVLTDGANSRLYRKLVKTNIVPYIETFEAPGDLYPNLFCFYSQPHEGHSNQEIEEAIYQTIEELKSSGVSEKELYAAKQKTLGSLIRGLQNNDGIAMNLISNEHYTGDAAYNELYLARIQTLTSEDIIRVASKYLTAENRTAAQIIKTVKPEASVIKD